MTGSDALDRGRAAFSRREWNEAHQCLSAAERESALGDAELEQLGVAAYMIGEESDAIAIWKRLHQELVDRGHVQRAARWGFWLSLNMLLRGEPSQSAGWLARIQRLVADGPDGPERGYPMIVEALFAMGKGDLDAAAELAEEASRIARRFSEPDLMSFALLTRGQALIQAHRFTEGRKLLDEAMVGVTSDDTSPMAAGIVYCAVILTCRSTFDLQRSREWTIALSEWCASQPDLVPFRGRCVVHRSEVFLLQGNWQEALDEAKRAGRWLSGHSPSGIGHALYQQAEVHRLRGDLERAEALYQEAGRHDFEPQPGASLLRLAEGRLDAAEGAIRRVVQEARGTLRAAVLGPYVDIMLAAGHTNEAREATDELKKLAAEVDAPLLHAVTAKARGAVLLAEGDAEGALAALRKAWELWQGLEAPYESACARVLIAHACEHLGDIDTARMHRQGAASVFERLGARTDLERIAPRSGPPRESPGNLSERELEVLVLVASGKTNRQVAADLGISEHTVARHLSNIFDKLGVSSRTAASAFAFEHGLL